MMTEEELVVAAACWELFSGKGDVIAKRQRQRQGGGARETTPGIQCWPQWRLVPRQWYCPPNNCSHPGIKKVNGDGDGNSNNASILCG
jgi:hypothetical protein